MIPVIIFYIFEAGVSQIEFINIWKKPLYRVSKAIIDLQFTLQR